MSTWTNFLKQNKGSGLSMLQLSAKYRQEHRLKHNNRSPCNKHNIETVCKQNNCSWVKNTTVHRGEKTYGRKGYCRGARSNWEKKCLQCGNVKYVDEWNSLKCDRCLKLNAKQHDQLGLQMGAFQRYKESSLIQRGGSCGCKSKKY